MWAEFQSISIWLRGFFSGYSGFPPSSKSTLSVNKIRADTLERDNLWYLSLSPSCVSFFLANEGRSSYPTRTHGIGYRSKVAGGRRRLRTFTKRRSVRSSKKAMPYNNRTEEYWPSVIFVTDPTSSQYFPRTAPVWLVRVSIIIIFFKSRMWLANRVLVTGPAFSVRSTCEFYYPAEETSKRRLSKVIYRSWSVRMGKTLPLAFGLGPSWRPWARHTDLPSGK